MAKINMKKGGKDFNKKAIASFELALMLISIFAFSYVLHQTDSGGYYEDSNVESDSFLSRGVSKFFDLIKEPVIPLVSAAPSVCCEKTTSGAFCVNADESECDSDFKSSPTSCETTSYCKQGTCYDSSEGICMENTPQNVCNDGGGTWDARPIEEVPQCGLGCCILGDQAAFVSLVRCKKLSSAFGVENNYRTDINSEVACIAAAQGQDKGACVYEKDFERVCEFTTRADCGGESGVEVVNGTSTGRTFYKDLLCSAEELNTACARQVSTTCSGEDVYWTDSCGNLENVYSSDKDLSWNNGLVLEAEGICDPNDGTDKDCGNCEYLEGTRCAEWDGVLGLGAPAESNYYCQKTECIDREGNPRLNGESWCVGNGVSGDGLDAVGSRYFREVCRDGDVTVEACSDFRNEVCLSGNIDTDSGSFETAACRVNRWQDCTIQKDKNDCNNIDRRDCKWIPSVEGLRINGRAGGNSGVSGFSNPSAGDSFNNPTGNAIAQIPITGNVVLGPGEEYEGKEGLCVPNYSPGLEFWEGESVKQVCAQARAKCDVVYEKGLLGGSWKVKDNGECLTEEWAASANRACSALGDCGGNINYNGEFTDDGYAWKVNGDKKKFSEGYKNSFDSGGSISPGSILGGGAAIAIIIKTGKSAAVVAKGVVAAKNALFLAKSEAALFLPGTPQAVAAAEKVNLAKGALVDAKAAAAAGELSTFAKLGWVAVAYLAGQFIGSLLGFDSDNRDALSISLSAGTAYYYFIDKAFWTSFGIGAVLFLVFYKDTKVRPVTFDCKPWQAPTGGDSCEVCNDPDLPCSEYRCKSLGQNCEIVNEGTEQEACVNVNPQDVNPPVISPSEASLTSGLSYTNVRNSPPSPGFEVVNLDSSDGCLKAFTPVQFGVNTDEPSQCKIDIESKNTFEEMRNFIGGNNFFLYNHTELLVLPSIGSLGNSSFVLENGNEMDFFIRCRDKNGNTNSAEYAVELCIDPSPDTTAPTIEATSIENNACIAENQASANVEFYTNEPSQCRWSIQDKDYDLMQNDMDCSNEPSQINSANLWTCATDLTGISRDNADFYVRCKDQPTAAEIDRNKMSESLKFSLHGSTGLKLKNLQPNETVFGAVNPAPVELYAETLFGCSEGRSICYYSETGDAGDYIAFFDTDNDDGISTQTLSLGAGEQNYHIRCIDEGGNVAEDEIQFDLEIDENAPVIARVYEEDNLLKLVTVRDSECSYTLNSCDFNFDEGTIMPYSNTTVHVAEWNKDDTYYIKCRDEFRNEEADCSLVVRPSDDFL